MIADGEPFEWPVFHTLEDWGGDIPSPCSPYERAQLAMANEQIASMHAALQCRSILQLLASARCATIARALAKWRDLCTHMEGLAENARLRASLAECESALANAKLALAEASFQLAARRR